VAWTPDTILLSGESLFYTIKLASARGKFKKKKRDENAFSV
jgi:hypothetical protein